MSTTYHKGLIVANVSTQGDMPHINNHVVHINVSHPLDRHASIVSVDIDTGLVITKFRAGKDSLFTRNYILDMVSAEFMEKYSITEMIYSSDLNLIMMGAQLVYTEYIRSWNMKDT